jgi:hypothetical protein
LDGGTDRRSDQPPDPRHWPIARGNRRAWSPPLPTSRAVDPDFNRMAEDLAAADRARTDAAPRGLGRHGRQVATTSRIRSRRFSCPPSTRTV